MVARGRHRRALAPSVGCGVVFLDCSDGCMRPQRMHGRLIRTWHGAADHVYLVADRGRHWRTALGGHRRQRFPIVCNGIVFPRVVDRHPSWRARLRKNETAERVDLALVLGKGNVMRRERHRFLLRPLVGDGVVFVNHSDRLEAWRVPAEDVHLSVCRCAEQLFSRLWKRRKLRPLPLSESPARAQQTGERSQQSTYESHDLLLAWILYYKLALFLALTAWLTTFSGHSPESTRRTSPGAPAWSPAIACSLYQATCGLRMTLSRPRKGCGSGRGSGSTVSSAAPAICFASRARTSASVSTIGPRAQLIKTAVRFILPNAASPIIFRVCGVSGGCRDTKSDSRSSVSRSTAFPGTSNCPSFTKGSV